MAEQEGRRWYDRPPQNFREWWYRYAGSVAFVSLVILAILGFAKTEATINDIEDERAARASVVSEIIALFCSDNNEQDRTLARLVKVSLAGGTFGEEIDPATLTAFDIRVLSSIAKVQQAEGESGLQEVFKRKLGELQDTTPCTDLVESFQEGKPLQPGG